MNIGDKVPNFVGKDENSNTINFSDYNGKWIVLYFYPKDDTSGCTKEACNFRDNMEIIATKDVVVIGVSPDNEKSHKKFKEKYDLNFTLIADPEKEICNLFGVMGEKSMYGKKFIGVIRSTFLINDNGEIVYKWSNVKVDGHVDEVIKKIEELKK